MIRYRARYRDDLRELKSLTKDLISSVSVSIENSIKSLLEGDMNLAREVVSSDQAIDDLNMDIENRCMELLALQQPMAKDLRLIVGILKIGIDLERIGDLAVDIARVSIQSKDRMLRKKLDNIPRMAEIAVVMLGGVVRSLEANNPLEAEEVTKWDYEIDGLYVKVRDNLMKIAAENPALMDETIPLLMVNRHLERIGDHICNICESIVYMIEGKREHLN
jgi:phosphate transport system protein